MKSLLENITKESIILVRNLGDRGKEGVEALEDKRTCLAERVVYEYVGDSLIREMGQDFLLIAEGFPYIGDENSNNRFTLDPLDGTLYFVRKRSLNPFPITIALGAIQGDSYGDVTAAAIGDLTSGEIWSADKTSKTTSNIFGECKITGNESHDPLLQFDFYFIENAQARIKVRHPINSDWVRFESLNAGSVASQLTRVACGEADAFIGVKGPTPWEIAPGYLLIKNAGGYVISLNSGKEFGSTPFNEREREPIIAAKDEKLVRQIYDSLK